MITQFLITMFYELASSMFGWLHNHLPAPPTIWADLTAALSQFAASISNPIRYFLPILPLMQVALYLIGLWIATASFRLVRRVVSLFTGGGGNA